jgi:hypothetical protein
MPVRDLDGDAGPDRCPLTGVERAVLERVEIEPGIPGVGAGRRRGTRVEAADPQGVEAHRPFRTNGS